MDFENRKNAIALANGKMSFMCKNDGVLSS